MIKKRILPMLLAAFFIFCMLPASVFAASGPVEHNAGTPEELSDALHNADSGDTVRLTADIDYNTGIAVAGKSITFDLNGHTLNVVSSTSHGLEVGDGGVVDMTGNGEFNVTSSANLGDVFHYGVFAHNGGKAKVTSATGTGTHGVGVNAYRLGSCIEVTCNVKGFEIGAYADSGGHVIIGGNVEGDTAAYSYGSGSLIEVAGNVTATGNDGSAQGASAVVGGTVRVTGNATSNDHGVLCRGGTVWVGGNVTGGQTGVYVASSGGNNVTIDGTLTAPDYINIFQLTDGVPGTGNDAGYLVFKSGTDIVRVKIKSAAPGRTATLRAVGISVCPISETQVEMEKEAIDIVMRDGCTYVTCESWLHNTGESADIIAGTYYSLTQLNWISTLVDGKRVDVSLEKGLNSEGSNIGNMYFPERYTWRMHFAADERIKVVNTYWFMGTAKGAGTDTVGYILRSGAAWRGPVGSITVRMHPEDFGMEYTTLGGMQPTYIEEDGTAIWEREYIEPDEDITINSIPSDELSGVNPFAVNDDRFLPYQTMTARMLRNFYAGYYNGATWWGNWMFQRFGDTQSLQLYYCMGVSYYKLGYTEKALDMFGRINDNDELYGAMPAYYKALICEEAGDSAGYKLCLDSISQYLSGTPEGKMSWGVYWLKSRLDDIT